MVGIAASLAVTSFAWTLLHAGDADAFYPLTMPLTVGPGSISVAIALGSQRPQAASGLADLALSGGGAILGLAAVAATIFICYRFADRVVALLGRHGSRVTVRLSAFILLCIGIQFLWNGISALLAAGHPSG